MFSNPGIKKNEQADNLFKVAGIRCYGLSKESYNQRVKWVNENVEDIIKYKNGKLIKKAKSKVLYLSFCIEFSYFYAFMYDETRKEYKTYLPIEFDGTCKGFQPLAMLSNEKKLFKQLNISNSDKNERPENWYSYIILSIKEKLKIKLKSIAKNSELYDSIKRLNNFMWTRDIFNKIIMTYLYITSLLTKITYFSRYEYFKLVNTTNVPLTDKELIRKKRKQKKNKNNKNKDKDENIKIMSWYCANDDPDNMISSKDIRLLVDYLEEVINEDCKKKNRSIN